MTVDSQAVPALDLQTFNQIQPETLPRRVAAHLSTAIIDGGLQPGSPLPSFGQLAERFGVSRPVVREAVHILATQGLVEVRHGRVPTVAADNAHSLVDGLALSVRRRGGSFVELYEVRRTLESEAAALAAARRTEMDLSRLRDLLGRMRERLETTGADDVEADMGFHEAITDAAHNAVLSAVMAPLAALLRQVLHATPAGQSAAGTAGPAADELAARSVTAHQRIYDAIAAGDAAAARRAAVEHMELFESRWAVVQETLSEVIARVTRPAGRP